jgi:hypothetical protein
MSYTAPHPRLGSHGKSAIPLIFDSPPTLVVHRSGLLEDCGIGGEEDDDPLKNTVYAPSAINKPKAFSQKKETQNVVSPKAEWGSTIVEAKTPMYTHFLADPILP